MPGYGMEPRNPQDTDQLCSRSAPRRYSAEHRSCGDGGTRAGHRRAGPGRRQSCPEGCNLAAGLFPYPSPPHPPAAPGVCMCVVMVVHSRVWLRLCIHTGAHRLVPLSRERRANLPAAPPVTAARSRPPPPAGAAASCGGGGHGCCRGVRPGGEEGGAAPRLVLPGHRGLPFPDSAPSTFPFPSLFPFPSFPFPSPPLCPIPLCMSQPALAPQ